MRLTFFDFVSVLMLVVTELPVVLFVCAPAQSLLFSAIGNLFFELSNCVPWFIWLALRLVRCMEDCSARFVVSTRVF